MRKRRTAAPTSLTSDPTHQPRWPRRSELGCSVKRATVATMSRKLPRLTRAPAAKPSPPPHSLESPDAAKPEGDTAPRAHQGASDEPLPLLHWIHREQGKKRGRPALGGPDSSQDREK